MLESIKYLFAHTHTFLLTSLTSKSHLATWWQRRFTQHRICVLFHGQLQASGNHPILKAAKIASKYLQCPFGIV